MYVYGYEKKDRANIRQDELGVLQSLARVTLGYTAAEIANQVNIGALIRVAEQEENPDEEQIPQ